MKKKKRKSTLKPTNCSMPFGICIPKFSAAVRLHTYHTRSRPVHPKLHLEELENEENAREGENRREKTELVAPHNKHGATSLEGFASNIYLYIYKEKKTSILTFILFLCEQENR